jgi:DNA-binding response OmpR family regulator
MDGLITLAKLRASKKANDIPVIMITALSDEENIAGAQKGSPVEYVVKRFDYIGCLGKSNRL